MLISQMQHDRGRLEQHQVAIDERRDATVWIDIEIVRRFLRIPSAIHEFKLIALPKLFEHHMGRGVGVAGKVVKPVHDLSP
jgi:hypothetical protein